MQEISDSKEIQASLESSRKRFSDLFEHSPIALWDDDISRIRDLLLPYQQKGVKDFRKLFAKHPKMVTECIERINIIEVNRGALALLEVKNKKQFAKCLKKNYFELNPDLYLDALVTTAEGSPVFETEAVLTTAKGNKKDVIFKVSIQPDEDGTFNKVFASAVDITDRKEMEEDLRESEAKLADANLGLQDKNIAMREIMEQLEIEKKNMEKRIRANVDELLLPLLTRLKGRGVEIKVNHIEVIESNLKRLTSSFGSEISSRLRGMTPREIEICNLIRGGQLSKEIADLLDVTHKTVETHRRNIREKLGILNKKVNLASFLKTLDDPSPLEGGEG